MALPSRVRVVLDTNVLIGALRSRANPPSSASVVLEKALSGELVPIVDAHGEIEAEYREVAARLEHAEVIGDLASVALERLVAIAEPVDATAGAYAGTLRDEDDRMVLEVARAAGADAIVTWNVRDFPSDGGVPVWTPPELLAELRARSGAS